MSCPGTDAWRDMADTLPPGWFAALERHPTELPDHDLPLADAARQHVATCPTCRATLTAALSERAEWRWRWFCPDAAQLAGWLEGEDNTELEAHIRGCGRCRTLVRQQLRSWLRAGLLDPVPAFHKACAVGVPVEPACLQRVGLMVVTLACLLQQQAARASLSRMCARRPSAPGERQDPLTALVTRLESGRPWLPEEALTGVPWLQLRVDSRAQQLVLQAGESTTDRFPRFRLELRCGEQVVLSSESVLPVQDPDSGGELRVPLADLLAALAAGADTGVLLVESVANPE